MADLIRKMQEGHTVEDLDTVIDEVYEARGEYDSLDERLDDMEGGAPTPSTSIPAMDGTGSAGTADTYARGDHTHPSDTSKQNALSSAQLAAVNSGIDSTKVEQIETNKNNILTVEQMNGAKNIVNIQTEYFNRYTTKTNGDNGTITLEINNAVWTTYRTKFETQAIEYKVIFYVDSLSKNVQFFVQRMSDSYNYLGNLLTTTGTSIFDFTSTGGDTSLNLNLEYEDTAATASITLRCMIIPKSVYDAGFTDYQPYAMSNAELTAKEQQNEDNILSLLPTTYTKPTSATGIFLQSGGYCKIGNICLVCLRFSDSSEVAANTAIFSGLPLPVKDSTISADRILITVANNKNIEINVTSSGEIKLGGTALSGTNDITTAFVVYLAQS